jgi:hypothetical protein
MLILGILSIEGEREKEKAVGTTLLLIIFSLRVLLQRNLKEFATTVRKISLINEEALSL